MKQGWAVVVTVLMVIGACGCAMIAGMYALGLYLDNVQEDFNLFASNTSPTSTPVVIRPTIETSSSQAGADQKVIPGNESLNTLRNSEVPINDLRDLAYRLQGIKDIPLTVGPPLNSFELGNQQEFWVSNVDANEFFQVSASLEYITDHLYFWIQDGVYFDPEDVKLLAETFENEIYPTNREFFGSEWTPGVDGDPHLYILYAKGLGSNLAGYFSSADEQHPLAHEYSNAHEAFVLNSDVVNLSNEFAYGVLAHEFQHMIHWNRDRDEASWGNEGLSE